MFESQDSNAAMIAVDLSSIPGAGYGIWATTTIPVNTVFPFGLSVDAPEVAENDSKFLIPEIKQEQPEYISDILPRNNWLRYLNCARNKMEENMVAFQNGGSLVYRATKTIPPKTELLVDDCKRNDCWKRQHQNLVSYDDAIKHLVTTTTKSRPYQCDMCERTFVKSDHLKMHVRRHTREKQCECSECGKAFIQPSDLMVHMRVHTGEKPYECDLCGKSFSRSSQLKLHYMTHDAGENSHECDTCGSTYKYPSSLKRHLRLHSGKKPYECDVCGKSFVYSENLKIHIRRHTGEKPYKCDACGKSFAQCCNLKLHMKRHCRRLDL